jgi:hypothetical protein
MVRKNILVGRFYRFYCNYKEGYCDISSCFVGYYSQMMLQYIFKCYLYVLCTIINDHIPLSPPNPTHINVKTPTYAVIETPKSSESPTFPILMPRVQNSLKNMVKYPINTSLQSLRTLRPRHNNLPRMFCLIHK